MKPGKYDKKAYLLFTPDELDFLQANAWQMAEAFDLDTRIENLTDEESAGFYMWDLECLYDVSTIAREDEPMEQQEMIDSLLKKIKAAKLLT